MNMVGNLGKGESVWLAFFLYDVVSQFALIAKLRNDLSFAKVCSDTATSMQANIEKNAWDGEWYRRAYFDDGTPLGSSVNEECQIDSISQSWAVLSGSGDSERSKTAMDSLNNRLVKNEYSLVQLLDPPFDKSDLNPGYIKGYVPGVRENGGQYTHAAIWAAMAFAELGDSRKAWDILEMINPVNHAKTAEETALYRVEPYVVAADVYALSPFMGRGGWTWYTGSAGWMYRLITESVLGLRLETDKLYIEPCIPSVWKSYKISYRFRDTFYRINVSHQDEKTSGLTIMLDGKVYKEKYIRLVNDQKEHRAEVRITGIINPKQS
jgi:cellobiose phosphorylase